MIRRPTPLPEPPEPNAWLPTWRTRAETAAAALARATADQAQALPERRDAMAAEVAALRSVLSEYEAKGDEPIWPGCWFALPDLATGWRIRMLFRSLDEAPEGTVRLPYLGAAIGLCWRACAWIPAAPAPRGLPDKWRDDDLLAYGWKIIEELHAQGITATEISEVGAIVRQRVAAHTASVSKEAVAARAAFFGVAPGTPTGSSARPG